MNPRSCFSAAVAALIGASAISAQNTPVTDAQRRWWAHVSYLASDAFLGRATGSDSYRQAADYVAAQFKKAGLKPGAGRSFLQPVKFLSRRIVEEQSSLALVRDGEVQPLMLGNDATLSMRVAHTPSLEAPLVFVGYGLVIPEANYDDLGGLDLKGKVAVFFAGSPSSIPGPLRTHYQSSQVRWAALRQAGAIGTISVSDPRSLEIPWERTSPNRLLPTLALADPEFDPAPGQQLAATFNPAQAEKLFQGAQQSFAEVVSLSDAGQPLPRFPLPLSVRAKVRVETTLQEAPNVVGFLTGSDPVLRNEYVVLSAHLDHEGIGTPINGDAIYNGAMDNASGTATLIETAHAMATASSKPRRSVVFLAVAGEEAGLLGSQYYARSPTVPKDALVADINMDMFLPLFPMKMVMVIGLDESDLGAAASVAATSMGLAIQSDPEPQRNRLTRSDQYSFIREGIPAIGLKIGYAAPSAEADVLAAWTRDRYHAPSDDLQQPMDLQAAADFTKWVQTLCAAIADRAERPRWYAGSFFRRYAS